MEDWITGILAVLGTLMVLSGGTLIVLRSIGLLGDPARTAEHAASEPPPPAGRRFSLRRLNPPTQLIGWGMALLVLSAFTVGLISFGISLAAGTQ